MQRGAQLQSRQSCAAAIGLGALSDRLSSKRLSSSDTADLLYLSRSDSPEIAERDSRGLLWSGA